MITVIGKLEDTKTYAHRSGYHVLPKMTNWTPQIQERFIQRGFESGSDFLLLAPIKASGQYRAEIVELLLTILDNTDE
jgi:hypothetical protein